MAHPAKSYVPGALRVLVADDLGFMRIALRQIIESDGDMRVVGEARDGAEAVALARALRPDIVTMDVEMPVMDGIEATRRIVGEVTPPPIVIMVSGHTQDGAAATVEALRAGAADFISKESAFAKTDLGRIDSELRNKVRLLAERRAAPSRTGAAAATPGSGGKGDTTGPDSTNMVRRPASMPTGPVDLIVIAVSTGGPATLATLLRALGTTAAPVVIAQHMPQFFTACLAQSLTQDTGLAVCEGAHREKLLPGQVTIVPGAQDGIVAPREGGFELRLTLSDSPVHPSADLLFESAAMVARRPVAVILTGMGQDGVRGAGRFAQRDLPVLVQLPDTCVVGGMPNAALEAGVASEALTLDDIARRLRRWAAPDFNPCNTDPRNTEVADQ
jgi:two-component system chemotaxis response regulator CheB